MIDFHSGTPGPEEPAGQGAGAAPAPQPQDGGAAIAPTAARRTLALVAAVTALAMIAAGAVGAVIGHQVWSSPSQRQSAGSAFTEPPQGSSFAPGSYGYGNGPAGQAPSGGPAPSATGAPSNASAIAAKVDPALVDIDSSLGYQDAEGAGTGIVVTSDGEVLTNNHVIDGATKLTATDIGNGKTYQVTVVGYDPTRDLAVLQLQGASGLTAASIGDSSKIHVGDAVVGIGNAGGGGGTPSSAGGSITGLDKSITASDELSRSSEQLSGLIQVNADIQSGDSGGPLVDSDGEVIGIDTAGSAQFSFTGSTGEAYAIPIDEAVETAKEIEASDGSSTVHVGPTGFLGVSVEAQGGSGYGYGGGPGTGGGSTGSSGLLVASVLNGAPAQKAGLAADDTITSFDGHTVDSTSELSSLLLPHHPGDTVTLGWTDSSGTSHTSSLKLASGPPA